MATASIKKYIVKPENKIRIHDLVMNETEKVYQEITDDFFLESQGLPYGPL